jgi:hypothetical protein
MAGNSKLIEAYAQIHATGTYGNTSLKRLRLLRPEIQLLKPRSVIDYGCGQSVLVDRLDLGYPLDLYRYDPAIPAFAEKPKVKADLPHQYRRARTYRGTRPRRRAGRHALHVP